MGDLISRSALLEEIDKLFDKYNAYDSCQEKVIEGIVEAKEVLFDAPAVDAVEVVHGRWEKVIPTKSAAKWCTKVSCSICHRQGYDHHNYCPNCGAKMDGERRDNG